MVPWMWTPVPMAEKWRVPAMVLPLEGVMTATASVMEARGEAMFIIMGCSLSVLAMSCCFVVQQPVVKRAAVRGMKKRFDFMIWLPRKR